MVLHNGLFIGGCSGSGAPVAFESMRFVGDELHKVSLERGRFGGHTTSLGIAAGEKGFFVDSGSGILDVARFLKVAGSGQVFGLQTHEHNDHIDTLHRNPFLGAMSESLMEYHWPRLLIGTSGTDSVRRSFVGWPVGPGSDKKPKPFFPGKSLDCGGMEVKVFLQNHGFDVTHKAPGHSIGYRIETPAGAIVIATDHEIGTDVEYMAKFAEFVSGAKILYHDVQYRIGEYDGKNVIGTGAAMSRKGWGHSTPEMLAATLAMCKAPVARLIIGHHDPERGAKDLEKFEAEAKETFGAMGIPANFAREGKYFAI